MVRKGWQFFHWALNILILYFLHGSKFMFSVGKQICTVMMLAMQCHNAAPQHWLLMHRYYGRLVYRPYRYYGRMVYRPFLSCINMSHLYPPRNLKHDWTLFPETICHSILKHLTLFLARVNSPIEQRYWNFIRKASFLTVLKKIPP